MNSRHIRSLLATVLLAGMLGCSSSSSPDNDTGPDDNGNARITTGLIAAFTWDGNGTLITPEQIYQIGEYYMFASGVYDYVHACPECPGYFSGTTSFVRVYDGTPAMGTSAVQLEETIAYALEKLDTQYLLIGMRPGGSLEADDRAYAAVLTEHGTIEHELVLDWDPPGNAGFRMAEMTPDGYLLFNDNTFIYVSPDLEVQWEETLTTEWDSELPEGYELNMESSGDLAITPDGEFVILKNISRRATGDGTDSYYGYGIMTMNAQGDILSTRTWYPEDPLEKLYAGGLYILDDGTSVILNSADYNYGEQVTRHITQVDSNGDLIQDAQFPEASLDCVTMGPNGFLYTAWKTDDTDPDEVLDVATDLHVAKLGLDGNILWQRVHENLVDAIFPSAIMVASDGGIVITGEYINANGTSDRTDDDEGIMLIKLNAQGECPDCD